MSAIKKIGIVGLGYVGLPLAVAFAEAGHEVVGLDSDRRKVDGINAGRSHIEDIADATLGALGGRLRASADQAELAACDAVVICVPTPLTELARARPHLLARAPATALSEVLQPGQLVVLESTTYPGTTRERLQPILEESGLAAGTRLPPRLLAGADRPRPHRLHGADHAEAGRRHHPRLRRARPRPLRADLRRGRRPLQPRGGRALEAAGEHLPLGQHRPRQRAGPALRPPRRSTSGR